MYDNVLLPEFLTSGVDKYNMINEVGQSSSKVSYHEMSADQKFDLRTKYKISRCQYLTMATIIYLQVLGNLYLITCGTSRLGYSTVLAMLRHSVWCQRTPPIFTKIQMCGTSPTILGHRPPMPSCQNL